MLLPISLLSLKLVPRPRQSVLEIPRPVWSTSVLFRGSEPAHVEAIERPCCPSVSGGAATPPKILVTHLKAPAISYAQRAARKIKEEKVEVATKV